MLKMLEKKWDAYETWKQLTIHTHGWQIHGMVALIHQRPFASIRF